MEEIGTCATKLAECLWDPISRHARYLFCFNKFIGDIAKAKLELEVKLAYVNMRKEDAYQKAEEIMPSVKKWLEEVNAILEEVQKLQQELERGGNKSFNVSLRYSLAKQIEDKANRMKELESNSSFEPFSLLIPLPRINTQFSSKEVMDFKSRKSIFNSLLEAIKDGKNKMVGLYGMVGSGKTTLAIEVGKKVEQLKLFDKVVMVVVSQHLNVRSIQEEIKGKTSLNFEEPTDSANAQRLIIGLRSMKVLIILDDVREYLRLEDIGIPLVEGCHILLTTRLRNVCVSMDCETIVELPLITKEEAWELFKKHANLSNDHSHLFDLVGKKIIDECKEPPIAIVAVGSSLKGKPIKAWESALWRLKYFQPLNVEPGLRNPYACLELSYDSLPSLTAKSLFLLCSVFPEDHEIHKEDLIRFGKGTIELDESIDTMEDVRREISVALNILLDSCLLIYIDKQACVKMHDLVRDVALWIAKKKGQAILVDRHVVSRMLVKNETLKETKAISLWNLENNFKLSNQLHCPTLEILLLHLAEGFIEDLGGIESLKVLALITFSFKWRDYYWKWIQWSMPQSTVSSLKNLHTLCFRAIALGDISFLSQLKILEILDLRGSRFDELPAAIVYMKKLKLLDVFACTIEKSPLEVIRRCEQLNELYFWDRKSVITENFSLTRLRRYAIYDSTFESPRPLIDYDLPFLEYYDDDIEALRALCIQGFKVSTLNSSMKDFILRANCLWLKNCMWDHNNINSKIKHLGVSHCPDKRFIVDNIGTNFPQTREVFSYLITLRLEQMYSLEQMFQDSSIRCSLPKLQELYMKRCPNLTTILTRATVTSMPDLRKLEIGSCEKLKWVFSYSLTSLVVELRIWDCLELESLIGEEAALGDRLLHDMQENPYKHKNEKVKVVNYEESFKNLSSSNVYLPKLERIWIMDCHKVRRLFSYSLASHCPSLEEITIWDCSQLEGVVQAYEGEVAYHHEKLFPKMNDLDLKRLPKLREIYPGYEFNHLSSTIQIEDCPNIRNISL